MSEHSLKIEFYKPTYNTDVEYDNDYGLNVYFTNIKGSFFMTMNDDYNEMYCEDEECSFNNGDMKAYVDLTEFMDRMASNDYRFTDGKAKEDWVKKLCGDVGANNGLVIDGRNCFDKIFWDDFFKETPKDEIKDFIEFCKANIELPNLEVDTIENRYDCNGNEFSCSIGNGYPITINDDWTIEMAETFTCKSSDVNEVIEDMELVKDDEYLFESKKSKVKSLKEKNEVNYWDVLDKIKLPLKYKNEESYCFAKICVSNLYNDDEYDSDNAKIYFIDCYLSDLFPTWEEDIDMNDLAESLYKGKMKWKDIDSSWF